jgi:hypothetical protein
MNVSSLAAAGVVLACGAVHAAAPACSAQSPRHTVALVELYTSEGCDSCPPADRWLSSLFARGLGPAQVVPLALHVDYWDYIGWKDPYAKRQFSTRQHKLARLGRATFVYTPQVLLQGRDFRGWASDDFAKRVAEINARPPRASLSLAIRAIGPGGADVEIGGALADPALRENVAVYAAAYENKLSSEVRAGENRGRRLEHDFVVREWLGPMAFGADGRLAEKRTLPLLPDADPARSGVAAFVQNRRTAEVLQALMLPACSRNGAD